MIIIHKKIQLFASSLIILLLTVHCGNDFQKIDSKPIHSGQLELKRLVGPNKLITFLFSVPNNYNPQQPYPLLVALHGYGDCAAAFHDLWKPATDSLGYVLLTPQGEIEIVDNLSYSWGENAERSVLACMDAVRKIVHVNPRRTYLTGFSMGGRLTYELGFAHTNIFRGIAALGARFESSCIPANKKSIEHIRVYIGHGTLEKNYLNDAHFAATFLQQAGLTIKFAPYEGIGHDLPEPKEDELKRIIEFFEAEK